MSNQLRYVHIGVGGYGQHWCTHVLPRLRDLGLAIPVAAVDIDPDVLPSATGELGISETHLFRDAREAIEHTRPHFITAVVPPSCHEAMVDLAIEYGCHILTEKPLADTMAGCCRIYRKVARAGLKVAVTTSHRFDQDKQTLERRLRSGQFGPLDYLVGRSTCACRRRGQWGQFRYDIADPLLLEAAVHPFDIMRALTGANARRVHCLTWNPAWSEFAGDCQAHIAVEMENGVKVLCECAKANAAGLNGGSHDYWRAECRDATVILDGRQLTAVSDLAETRRESVIPLDEQPAWGNAWLAELFCRWLLGGDPPPNTLEDNAYCAALLFAAIESAHRGATVDVPAFLARHLREVERG